MPDGTLHHFFYLGVPARRRVRGRNVWIKMLSLPRRMTEWCCQNFSPLYSGGNVWKTTELLLQIFN
jgi:hypothetical protein